MSDLTFTIVNGATILIKKEKVQSTIKINLIIPASLDEMAVQYQLIYRSKRGLSLYADGNNPAHLYDFINRIRRDFDVQETDHLEEKLLGAVGKIVDSLPIFYINASKRFYSDTVKELKTFIEGRALTEEEKVKYKVGEKTKLEKAKRQERDAKKALKPKPQIKEKKPRAKNLQAFKTARVPQYREQPERKPFRQFEQNQTIKKAGTDVKVIVRKKRTLTLKPKTNAD